MTIQNYLQNMVDYIEDSIDVNIEDVLSLDSIASHMGFSKYYLNGLFSIYTGMSIMVYVRRRKLYWGLRRIEAGRTVQETAYSLGYSSERAFSRAVSSYFGHSPGYYKQNCIPIPRKLTIYNLKLDTLKGGSEMKSYLSDVSYESIPQMTVISGIAEGSEPEDAIIALMNHLKDHYDLWVTRYFGFDSPVEGDHDPSQYRGYEFWLAVDSEEIKKLPSESFTFEDTPIQVKTIPGFRYATLSIENPFEAPFERIPGGWKALVAWLEDHDFKDMKAQDSLKVPQGANCLEEVIENTMRIYIPIDLC